MRSFFQKNKILSTIVILFFFLSLFGIKGAREPLTTVDDIIFIQQNSPKGFIGTPLEFSRARTQFLQVISLYNRDSFIFTEKEASVTRPDAGYFNGTFRSLAPPGLSLIMYPFYFLGTQIELGQLFSFFPLILMYGLSIILCFFFFKKTFQSDVLAGFLSILYGFGTLGVIYASSPLYHTFSLLGIFTLALWTRIIYENPSRSQKYFILTNILIGLSVFVDYAHPLIFLPFYLYQIILLRRSDTEKSFGFIRTFFLSLSIPLLCILGLLIMQKAFFGDIFQMTNTQVQYTSEAVVDLSETDLKNMTDHKNGLNDFLETRFISRNLKEMFFRENRGFFNLNPLLLLSFLAIPFILKKRRVFYGSILPLAFSSLITVLVYASFAGGRGDYSVGVRYLIPIIPLFILFFGILLKKITLDTWVLTLLIPILFWNFFSHLSGFFTTIYSHSYKTAHSFGVMQWDYLLEETTSSFWFNHVFSDLPLFVYPLVFSLILTYFSVTLLRKIND